MDELGGRAARHLREALCKQLRHGTIRGRRERVHVVDGGVLTVKDQQAPMSTGGDG